MRRVRAALARCRERGAVAVEFALVLPLLLLLVLGGIDWGYYFFAGEIVANAAREGARAGSIARIRLAYTDPCADDGTTAPGAISVAKNYLLRGALIASDSDARLKSFDATCPSMVGNSCCQRTTMTIGGATVSVVRIGLVYQARPGSMSLTGFLPAKLLPTAAAATATMRLEP